MPNQYQNWGKDVNSSIQRQNEALNRAYSTIRAQQKLLSKHTQTIILLKETLEQLEKKEKQCPTNKS